MEAEYKDGEKIEFVENTFDLTEKQKTLLSDAIKKITKNEHLNIKIDKEKIHTKLSDEQKTRIIKFKNFIFDTLKESLELSNDEEFIEYLRDNDYISLSSHAEDRLIQRFGVQAPMDSPFDKLAGLQVTPVSSSILGNDAINVVINSDTVGDKVEWPAPKPKSKLSFSRIRLKETGNKMVVITEIDITSLTDLDLELMIIVTVIKKD